MSHDDVVNPRHYDLFADGMQAIDVIEAALSPEEFAGYLKGSVLKYRLRAGEKGEAQGCLAKANWYRARLAELVAEQAALRQAADGWSPEAVAAAGFGGAGAYEGLGGVMLRCPGCRGGCECLA